VIPDVSLVEDYVVGAQDDMGRVASGAVSRAASGGCGARGIPSGGGCRRGIRRHGGGYDEVQERERQAIYNLLLSHPAIAAGDVPKCAVSTVVTSPLSGGAPEGVVYVQAKSLCFIEVRHYR